MDPSSAEDASLVGVGGTVCGVVVVVGLVIVEVVVEVALPVHAVLECEDLIQEGSLLVEESLGDVMSFGLGGELNLRQLLVEKGS